MQVSLLRVVVVIPRLSVHFTPTWAIHAAITSPADWFYADHGLTVAALITLEAIGLAEFDPSRRSVRFREDLPMNPALAAAILDALSTHWRPATAIYAAVAELVADGSYRLFFAGLLLLDKTGVVELGEKPGTGDDPPVVLARLGPLASSNRVMVAKEKGAAPCSP